MSGSWRNLLVPDVQAKDGLPPSAVVHVKHDERVD